MANGKRVVVAGATGLIGTVVCKHMNKPCWLPTPGFLLKLFLGKVAISVTQAQRVVPAKALKLGYQFKYDTSEDTLRSIIK